MSVDLFLILMLPFFVYGAIGRGHSQSRTTVLVLFAVALIAFSSKFLGCDEIFIEVYMFMIFLFVRATFRKKIKEKKFLREFFYA